MGYYKDQLTAWGNSGDYSPEEKAVFRRAQKAWNDAMRLTPSPKPVSPKASYVYTAYDGSRAIAEKFGMSTDRSTLRRVDNGYDIFVKGLVSRIDGPVCEVRSQFGSDWYEVRAGRAQTACTCPDWSRANRRLPKHYPVCMHICKHGVAVRLQMEFDENQPRGGQHTSPTDTDHEFAGQPSDESHPPRPEPSDGDYSSVANQIYDFALKSGAFVAVRKLYLKWDCHHPSYNPTGSTKWHLLTCQDFRDEGIKRRQWRSKC